MVLLQHKLSVKLSQRQILTPGLVQMVSVLALNKLELKDMINAEMVENPVLEELEESVPLIDEIGRKEEDAIAPSRLPPKKLPSSLKRKTRSKKSISDLSSRTISIPATAPAARWKRSSGRRLKLPLQTHHSDRPPGLATRCLSLRREVREAAEQIIGNLNEDGYLIASDEEMLGVAPPAPPEADAAAARNIVSEAAALGLGQDDTNQQQPRRPPKPAFASDVNDLIGAAASATELFPPDGVAGSSLGRMDAVCHQFAARNSPRLTNRRFRRCGPRPRLRARSTNPPLQLPIFRKPSK